MPLVDLANPLESGGVRQLAGPFGSYLPGGSQFPNSYDIGKTFISTASSTQGGGNGVTSLDDPTYLGFSLTFDISSPLFNGATIGNTEPPQNPEFATTEERVNAGHHASGESAVGYLEKIGETTRATYLRAFIQGMREIQLKRSYYWQTIDGLTTAWNNTVNMIDPYGGSKEGEGITIGCLEAIDLKMTALFNLYKMAVYDVKYKRTILPINLMYFNVYVDVYEIRKFQTTRNWLKALNLSDSEPDTLNYVNENTSKVTFKFEECCWIPEETGKVFEGVTMAGGNAMAVSSMKWSYGHCEMESQFSGYNSKLMDGAVLQPGDGKFKFDEAAKQIGKDILANQAQGAINKLERGASSLFQSFALGNVFGIRNQVFQGLSNPQAVLNELQGAAVQLAQSSGGNDSTIIKLADNPLGEGVQPDNSLPTDNINAGQIPQSPKPLNSNNIFGNGPSGPAPLESNNVFE